MGIPGILQYWSEDLFPESPSLSSVAVTIVGLGCEILCISAIGSVQGRSEPCPQTLGFSVSLL